MADDWRSVDESSRLGAEIGDVTSLPNGGVRDVARRDLRLLYVTTGTPVPGRHGGSVHATELCRALARLGHEVHVAAPDGDDGPLPAGLTRHALPRRPPFLEWTLVGALRRWIRELRPDVVLERFYTFSGAGTCAAHLEGVPSVLEINSPARAWPGSWRDRLDRLTIVQPVDRWRRAQLCWSRGLYGTSPALVPPTLRDRLRVVVNGVDPDRFRPAESSTAGGGPLRGVFVSSFRPWHAADDLVTALVRCRERGVGLRVRCLGDGPGREGARRAAAAAGLDGVIELSGAIPHAEVPRALAAAEVGIAPFRPAAHRALELGWFWSPIKLFEYLASGLAIVTADIPELRTLLPDDVALFYPPGDTDALADAIGRLANDRALLARLRANARALALERYTWDQQARAVEDVVRAALGEGDR